jgi:LuxR family quorum-sensing system transcriptional regulator CciR
VLDEAREAGLKKGISVPLHGPWGRVAVVSFASSHEHADPLGRSGRLYALASQFHVAFGGFAATAPNDGPGLQLSDRERECLQWSAMGKSSWDIGAILHISENTVTFHIKNAMKKLGTSSRTVAVVKAIRLNLIDLAWAFRDTAYPG